MKPNLLYFMAINAKHTITVHPVGFYRDVFAGDECDCLENKYI